LLYFLYHLRHSNLVLRLLPSRPACLVAGRGLNHTYTQMTDLARRIGKVLLYFSILILPFPVLIISHVVVLIQGGVPGRQELVDAHVTGLMLGMLFSLICFSVWTLIPRVDKGFVVFDRIIYAFVAPLTFLAASAVLLLEGSDDHLIGCSIAFVVHMASHLAVCKHLLAFRSTSQRS